MMAAGKKKRAPPETQTYAARVARGRVPVAIHLPPDGVELLGELADASGQTRSAIVYEALRLLGEKRGM